MSLRQLGVVRFMWANARQKARGQKAEADAPDSTALRVHAASDWPIAIRNRDQRSGRCGRRPAQRQSAGRRGTAASRCRFADRTARYQCSASRDTQAWTAIRQQSAAAECPVAPRCCCGWKWLAASSGCGPSAAAAPASADRTAPRRHGREPRPTLRQRWRRSRSISRVSALPFCPIRSMTRCCDSPPERYHIGQLPSGLCASHLIRHEHRRRRDERNSATGISRASGTRYPCGTPNHRWRGENGGRGKD